MEFFVLFPDLRCGIEISSSIDSNLIKKYFRQLSNQIDFWFALFGLKLLAT